MPAVKAEWNVQAVGETAGRVWEYLQRSGKAALTAVERDIDTTPALVHMAIGWLAREGKIALQQEGRQTQLWLTE
jgi:hypothetical protein